MLSRSKTLSRMAPAFFAAAVLAGCADTDLYLDRRDFVSSHAGDAVATNIIVQTVDPWPRASGNRNIAFNGDRMQAAGERYRTGKVIEPKGLGTSSVDFGESANDGGSAPTQ
jgi:hypothetical protein